MEKILVSACLLGRNVRYDAGHNQICSHIFENWIQEGRLISICPEMAGGLPPPRAPAERVLERVLTKTGQDVTQEFQRGAGLSLELCQAHKIKVSILKARSPSCGNNEIYDGTFSRTMIVGSGVTADLLKRNRVHVFNENQILEADQFLKSISRT